MAFNKKKRIRRLSEPMLPKQQYCVSLSGDRFLTKKPPLTGRSGKHTNSGPRLIMLLKATVHLHMFRILTPRRIETFAKKAGLLAYASSLLPAFPSVLSAGQWLQAGVAPHHSGGTAPDFHRPSLLSGSINGDRSAPFSKPYEILIFIIISSIPLYVYRKGASILLRLAVSAMTADCIWFCSMYSVPTFQIL